MQYLLRQYTTLDAPTVWLTVCSLWVSGSANADLDVPLLFKGLIDLAELSFRNKTVRAFEIAIF